MFNEKIYKVASKRGYVVTEDGSFLNPKGKKIGWDKQGYLFSTIKVEGKSIQFSAHRLQAYQKYGNKIFEDGIVTRHKNGNPSDNSWDNILIGTQSDNMMDIPKQIRIKKAQHATSYVRKHDKEDVKKFHNKDKSYKKTMKKFGISSKGTLHYILNS